MDTFTKDHDVEIIPFDSLNERVTDLHSQYEAAVPFSHVVIDDFLNPHAAGQLLADFPNQDSAGWIHYKHVNERKLGMASMTLISEHIRAVIQCLNSERFLAWLTRLTGIEGLVADPYLEGGGLHQIERGGFLNIHADFTKHPYHHTWRRRINQIVYLNKSWQEEYGGHLELWDKQVVRCVRKVLPVFNRAVIFNTTEDSFHGHPDPLTCPEGRARKSLALYYYTEEAPGRLSKARSTNFRARPGDGPAKAAKIALDRKAVAAYSWAKRRLGLSHSLVSKLRYLLSRKK